MGTPVFAAYADGVVTTNPTLVAGVTSQAFVTVSLIALLALITTTTRVVNLRILILMSELDPTIPDIAVTARLSRLKPQSKSRR